MSSEEIKKADSVVIEITSNENVGGNTEEIIGSTSPKEEIEQLTEEESELLNRELNQIDEEITVPENDINSVAGEAANILSKFKNYINSSKLDDKCEDASKRTGVKKDIIKNAFVKNALRTIADSLNLTISIAGDIISGGVKFVETIISNIINFTTNTLHKLITAVTLNCGSVEY